MCGENYAASDEKKTSEMIPYKLRLFMLGDIAIQGISAEIVTSVGQQVREVSPYEKTILVSHALGYHSYVADEWEYNHDAFEVTGFAPEKGAAPKESSQIIRRIRYENRSDWCFDSHLSRRRWALALVKD